MDKRVE